VHAHALDGGGAGIIEAGSVVAEGEVEENVEGEGKGSVKVEVEVEEEEEGIYS